MAKITIFGSYYAGFELLMDLHLVSITSSKLSCNKLKIQITALQYLKGFQSSKEGTHSFIT
jgi:hypothetical protein